MAFATAFLLVAITMAGTITELRVQKKRKDRVSIYLDGHYAFGAKDIVAARLRVGQRLTDDDIAGLKEQDAFEEAYNSALNFLSYRPRSTAEVTWNLRGKGVPDAIIEAVTERLTRAGLLGDLSFAEYWVEQRERFKPRSARMLRHELRQKGVAAADIDQALQGLDEADSASRLANKRVRRYAHLDREEFWRKMVGYLQRRGFRYGTIKPIVQDLWQEIEHAKSDS
ncbi:MAG: Regulatory protein RecX [Anaerolineales bacterium]|nr:Regulatory protein RecX [Anaerolineales bacterium]